MVWKLFDHLMQGCYSGLLNTRWFDMHKYMIALGPKACMWVNLEGVGVEDWSTNFTSLLILFQVETKSPK